MSAEKHIVMCPLGDGLYEVAAIARQMRLLV